MQPGRYFSSYHNREERNIDTPRHSGGQVSVKTVDLPWRIATENNHGSFSIQQSHCDSFLRRTGYNFLYILFQLYAITDEYFVKSFVQFKIRKKERRPHLSKEEALFPHDNAILKKCLLTMSRLNEFSFEMFIHPIYPIDLVSSNYSLFPNLKKYPVNRVLSSTIKSVLK